MRGIFAISGVLFVSGIAFWFAANALRRSPLAGQVGADGLPKMLGITLAVLAVGLALQTYLQLRQQRRRSGAAAQAAASGDEAVADGDEKERPDHLRAFGLLAIGAAYILLLPILGYAVSAALVFGAVATYTGLKPSLKTVLFAVGGAVVYYIVFVRILQIPLPPGFWPSLLG